MVKLKIIFTATPSTLTAKQVDSPLAGSDAPGVFRIHEPPVGIEPDDLSRTRGVLLPLSYEGNNQHYQYLLRQSTTD